MESYVNLNKYKIILYLFKLTYDGIKYIIIDSDLAKTEVSTELLLWSKLGGPLCRSLMQTLLNTTTVRAKAIITSVLSLFNKFGGITALELGRGAMAGGDPERC